MKKTEKILIIISLIILIIGIVFGINLMNGVDIITNDGTNFSLFTQFAGILGFKFLGTLFIFGTIVLISSIWIIYWNILFIIKIFKKIKNKN